MIKLIPVNMIAEHYYNPRKELGDLTELADSIKARGILQNLTVVPWFCSITGVGADDPKVQDELGYLVLIGHRRLAAAKLAGLSEVPCAIVEMDIKTQISTMLLENMQRSDLTLFEQAQGMQMMLNMGDTVDNISEKTGFSKTTVRRRVKLLELDQDKLKESMSRNVSLKDYVELNKIKDSKLRNKVLDKIGTPNFNYELRSAIDKEKRDKAMAIVVDQLNTFAEKIKSPNGVSYVCGYHVDSQSKDKEIEMPTDTDSVKYYYTVSDYGSIYLYRENTDIDEVVNETREDKRKALYSKLEIISKRAYKLRREFISDISNTKAKKSIEMIIEYTVYTMGGYNRLYLNELIDLLNIKPEVEEETELDFSHIVDELRKKPEFYLLASTYCMLDSSRETYFNWSCEHQSNEDLDKIYNLLIKLGYQISDEEQKLRDGTHELFINEL